MQVDIPFVNLFNNSLTGMFILVEGQFCYVSPRFISITGYEESDLLNRSSLSIVFPEDREAMHQIAISMLRNERQDPYEYRIYHHDGSIHWQLETVTSIQYQGHRAVMGNCMDITAMKMATEARLESAETTRALLNASIDQALLLDLDGQIIASNAAGAKRFNIKLKELIGRQIYDMLPLAVAERRRRRLSRIIQTGKPDVFEDRLDKHYIANSVYPIFNQDGRVIRLAIFSRDITEQKKAEANIQHYQSRLRALTSELSLTEERERRRISSELHDNISQMLAMSKIKLAGLLQCLRDTDVAPTLGEIYKLINESIDFTRSLTFELSSPILYELGFIAAVEWCAEQVQEQSGINITVINQGFAEISDEETKVTLFKAVRELLHNVVKHAQADQVTINLSRDADSITITVADNGIGLKGHHFDGDYGTKNSLGLFNIRERLEYLSGKIIVESSPDQFTRVSLVLPLKS
jgi:PAS domain S-box-containing protein